MIIWISILTVLSTFLGGLFALKFKDKLHLILGFSAGAVIGVAFFDLLPESLELAIKQYEISAVTSYIAGGFILFMIFDRLFSFHAHDDEVCQNQNHRGKFGATTLSIHSFLDGVAVGLAFQVSTSVGLIVTAAVLAHDFSDGINTVNLILKNKGSKKQALKWLILDAIAPALGIFSTLFFTLSQTKLGIVLAIFTGFFFYIGASDLLPESHHRHPFIWTTISTILGVSIMFLIIQLAKI